MNETNIKEICQIAVKAVQEVINGAAEIWRQAPYTEKILVLDRIASALVEKAGFGASPEEKHMIYARLKASIVPLIFPYEPLATTFDQLDRFAQAQTPSTMNFYYQGWPVYRMNKECFLLRVPQGMLRFTPDLLLLTGLDDNQVRLVQAPPSG